MEAIQLEDGKHRTIDYMRISVTDRCNLSCAYCMPGKNHKFLPKEELLSLKELYRICKLVSEIGIHKLKITGGEPLLREGIEDFITQIKKLPGIECVTLTTNGTMLRKKLPVLKKAGIDGINISLDSMNPVVYKKVTGFNRLEEVLEAVQSCIALEIPTKLNCVVLKEVNESEIREFVKMAKQYPVIVRFIEMMPLGEGSRFESVSGVLLRKQLEQEFGVLYSAWDVAGNGPAVYYHGEDFKGRIGFINAVSQCFCAYCNRIRMSADGYIQLCLSHPDGWNMKHAIRSGMTDDEIKQKFITLLKNKPAGHDFNLDIKERKPHDMWQIGG